MADRTSRFDNRNNNGRRFNAREMAVIHESNHNGGNFKAVSRGVGGNVAHPAQRTSSRQSFQPKKSDDNLPDTIRKQEQSLMNCQLNDGDARAIWDHIQHVVEGMNNTDPMFDKFLALGNYYQHGNFCEFQMGMYRSHDSEQNLLDFKRMSGDGFVMDSFFRDVRNKLRTQNPELMMDIDDDLEDDDDMIAFDDFTDSEDEDDSGTEQPPLEFLQIGGPLNLKADSSVVKTWIDDCQNRHIEDKNHRMGLMAHNAANADNLEEIIEKGGEELTALIRDVFTKHEHAAYVRNASVLVKHMSTMVDFDDAMLACMFEAISFWVPGNGRKETFRLTESRETVFNLGTVFTNLIDRSAVTQESLQAMADELSGNQKQVLSDYVMKADDHEATSEQYANQIALFQNLI